MVLSAGVAKAGKDPKAEGQQSQSLLLILSSTEGFAGWQLWCMKQC